MNTLAPKTYEQAKQAATRRAVRRLAHQEGKKPRYGLSKRPRKPLGYSGRLGAGRKTKAWTAERRKLKAEYEAMGITSCELRYEGCKGDDWLSFAHGRKRRKLVGNELSTLTILACLPCHDRIEFLPPEDMLRIVNDTIATREAT